ncbi:DUF3617 domain-containing protein [Sphingomonas flavalba]|uniref:DUF3617 domain-containing protein n=1 Tax=Sphingomonas flavalba TaxID=2559804 RepID=UPI0039E16A99
MGEIVKLTSSIVLEALLILSPLSGGAAALAVAPQPVARLKALASVEPGRWQLKPYDGVGPARSICIAEAASLLQVQHPGSNCTRFVIDDQPASATVHYTCPGNGHGRTTIKVETSRLLDISSQGISANAPFNMRYEARRVGAC